MFAETNDGRRAQREEGESGAGEPKKNQTKLIKQGGRGQIEEQIQYQCNKGCCGDLLMDGSQESDGLGRENVAVAILQGAKDLYAPVRHAVVQMIAQCKRKYLCSQRKSPNTLSKVALEIQGPMMSLRSDN